MSAAERLILCLTLVLLAAGCGGGSSNSTIELSGFVKDLNTGDGVPGANVTVGNLSAGTDTLGFFRLILAATGEQTVRITRTDYFDLTLFIEIDGGTNVLPDQVLIPLDAVTENPYAVSSSPTQDETGVALGSPIEITFSETVDLGSFDGQSVLISPYQSLMFRQDGAKVSIVPIDQYKPGRDYTLRLRRGVTDSEGKPLINEFHLRFSTAEVDSSPPVFLGTSPQPGATSVSLGSALSFTFNEEIIAGDLSLNIEPLIEGNLQVTGRTVTFTHTTPFEPDTTYSGTLDGQIADATGNSALNSLAFSFSTGASVGEQVSLEPAFSPDGRRIAFASNMDSDFDIWCVDEDGSNLVNLTDDNFDNRHPSWAPDFSGIVFSSTRHGNTDIYIMDTDGLEEERLTSDEDDDVEPVFDTDFDLKIYFCSDREGDFLLYEMNVTGGGLQPVSPFSPNDDREPAPSPLGPWLLYTSTRAGDGDVWYKSSDPSDLHGFNLTYDFTGTESSPCWDIDGLRIFFASDENGSSDIWWAAFPGGAPQLLSKDDSNNEWMPAVSPVPGDQRLLIVSDHEGSPDLYYLDATGGEITSRLIADGG